MNKSNVVAAVLAAALPLLLSAAEPPADAAAGKQVFQLRCAPCHGAGRGGDPGREMLPGTDALRIKYKGALPALLEQRTDLPEAVLRVYLRHGSWSMPAFRKTELSDLDIGNIAAYLAVSSRSGAQ
jgi:mono/diheme cytochrome c family protein